MSSRARILTGVELARSIWENIRLETSILPRAPCLAVLQVGSRVDSMVYIRNKIRAADHCGINVVVENLHHDTSQLQLLDAIQNLNQDTNVDGLIVQLPLPAHLDSRAAIFAVDPMKDVDGLHPLNAGRLFVRDVAEGNAPAGRLRRHFHESGYFIPCTAMAIRHLLHRSGIAVENQRVVIINRSMVVGIPVAALLLRENACVTLTHRLDKNLKELTREADILITASGVPKLITVDYVKEGAVVIDVAINEWPIPPSAATPSGSTPPSDSTEVPLSGLDKLLHPTSLQCETEHRGLEVECTGTGGAHGRGVVSDVPVEVTTTRKDNGVDSCTCEAVNGGSNSPSTRRRRRICGDVDFDSVVHRAAAITPVPGGVGPLTVACLMQNTLKAYRRQVGFECSTNEGVYTSFLNEERREENSFDVC